jgi:hypothetical protein
MKFRDIPQFPQTHYSVDVPWGYIESTLERYNEGGVLQLDPPFQRLHVWTVEQQIAYVEFKLKGGTGADELYFSQADWGTRWAKPMYLVDGKQRLEAVRSFLRGELPVFGVTIDKFEDKMPSFDYRFKLNISALKTMADVIHWYVGINAGGTVHTQEEIQKALDLLESK